MLPSIRSSDSLIGGLCREAAAIRCHSGQISAALSRCRDPRLAGRLQQEQQRLLGRRNEIQQAALTWRSRCQGCSTGIELLIELCRRPPVS